MPKKLNIDSLTAEINTVTSLLDNSKSAGDIVGELQFQYRLEKLQEELTTLKKHKMGDNNASVALLFGGKPVIGSKGIAANFAGVALDQIQNLIAKTFATTELGQIGARGKVPTKSNSNLMVTELARGSFGFVLDEMSDQSSLEESELTFIIDKVAGFIKDAASEDEGVFETLIENLDPRTLLALKEIFVNLDSSEATIRIVEGEKDIALDSQGIHRARLRTEATSIEEETSEISGVLEGVLPEHRKFEIRDDEGKLIYGSVAKEALEQFESASKSVIGNKCLASVLIKTVRPLNRPSREVYRLIKFLQFNEGNS